MRALYFSKQKANGFSLAELLVAIAVGSIVFLAAAQILISHIRTNARMEAMMRLQDHWSRLQFFLNQEVQEARGASASGSSLFLTIPNSDNPAQTQTITYALSGDTLTREGPAIASNGALIHGGGLVTHVVMRGVSSFTPLISAGGQQQVSFSISLTDPSGVTLTERGSAAVAKARIIN